MSGGGWSSPWAIGAAALIAASLVVDARLRRVYAGGNGRRDGSTAVLLAASLTSNIVALLAMPYLGLGMLPASVAHAVAPAGFALTIAGIALRYHAIRVLGDRFTWRVSILEEHALVNTGVYALVRHPSYAGGILGMAGAALAFGCWGSLVLLATTHVPLLARRMRIEEDVLLEHFGPVYRHYIRRTKRLVPYVF